MRNWRKALESFLEFPQVAAGFGARLELSTAWTKLVAVHILYL